MSNDHIPYKVYSLSELQYLELGKSTKPFLLKLNELKYEVKNWANLMELLITFLISEGYLVHNQLPIYSHSEGDKYLINNVPQHKIIERNGYWKQIDKFHVDVKYNAEAHIKNIIHLSKVLGLRGKVEIGISLHEN